MNPTISAIICTHNRSQYLKRAIESLVNQTLARTSYEIIVVDNCSSDETRRIVTEKYQHIDNLRYAYEPILGVCRARNNGWKQAKGTYVSYLDDDATAATDWLEKIVELFVTIKPSPVCVCGKVELAWETRRPSWLNDLLLPYLAHADWSETRTTLDPEQWPVNTNMAFAKQILHRLDGFPTFLSKVGNKLLTGEDRYVQLKLHDMGYDCLYDPHIQVKHYILSYRLTKRWFIRNAFWVGVTLAVIEQHRKRLFNSKSLKKWRVNLFQRIKFVIKSKTLPSPFTIICYMVSKIGYTLGKFKIVK
jgi:glycosyltransferase involved in cell wall biosynthesis